MRPRLLTHRGVVEANALLFDTRLLPLETARERVLALWKPGAMVYRLEAGLLLKLPAPCRVVCALAPGLPLVRSGDLLASTPITEAERKRLPLQSGLLLVRNGEAVVMPLSEADREDPADWLDMSAWRAGEAISLGAPPALPEVVVETPQFDARARMKGVPAADPQSAVVAEKLRAALRAQREGRAGTAGRGGEVSLSPARRMFGSFLERLAHLGEARPGEGSSGRGADGGGSREAPETRPGLTVRPQTPQEGLSPFQSWLKHMAARTLMLTGLARHIGQQQADYMARMMEMFEKGELDEALRHAIPLGGEQAGGRPLPPSLGVPGPRTSLDITTAPAQSSLYGGIELFTDLKSLYRRAYEQLVRQGRIEEAAFVLAELLHASGEAVAFLEEHGKLQLAAEIAEARGLAPEMVVRQWILAGNQERAVRIARKHHAFGAAVELLQHKNPQQAVALRRLWAEANAETGDYVAAVDLLWPDPTLRAETLRWMREALAFGGVPAARMLPRLLELTPDDPELQPRILAFLAEEEPEQAPDRKEFAQSLAALDPTPRSATLARAALRAVVRDAFLTPHLTDRELVRQLNSYGADASLRADLPTLPTETMAEGLDRRETPLELEWAAQDIGALPLSDAALLPNGRCLVALGEAGVRLLARDGRAVAHFDQPAQRLVVADSGTRAIAIASRGTVLRLARIDPVRLQAAHWCETMLQAFAPDYDGSLWFVATQHDLLAIDATAERFQALWRTPELTGVPVQIARNLQDCALLLREPQLMQAVNGMPQLAETWWMWRFALPSLTMRDRKELPPSDLRLAFTRGIAPGGATAELLVRKEEMLRPVKLDIPATGDLLQLNVQGPVQFTDSFYAHEAQPMQPILTEAWVAAPFRFDRGVGLHLYDRVKGRHRATLRFYGATLLTVRLNEAHLTLADDRGRLIVLDLRTARLVRDLRIH